MSITLITNQRCCGTFWRNDTPPCRTNSETLGWPGTFFNKIIPGVLKSEEFLFLSTELLSRADGGLVSGKQRDYSSISAVTSTQRCPVSSFSLTSHLTSNLNDTSWTYHNLGLMCPSELLKLQQLSRNSGFPVCERDRKEVMEKAVRVFETLRIVLLNERHVKGMLTLKM